MNAQIKYDILLVNISAVILLTGLLTRVFYDGALTVIWLPSTSAAGLLLLLGYLLAVGWFLDLCEKEGHPLTDYVKLVAKACYWGAMALSAAVIVLLAIM